MKLANQTSTIKILIILAIGSFLARLLLAAFVELLPEESYYWNYSSHLALGYLDHPPLTAWTIAGCTYLFGLSEFAVRFGALAFSFVAAFFIFKIAALLFDKTIACLSILFLSVLPYFIGNNFYISPDAGLVAAWSASLYFIISIIEAGQSSNKQTQRWILLGFWIGIGLLSKYTIALLAFSGFLVFVLDKRLHFWFKNPAPYFALIFAFLIFSPVIYWNATHQWASFLFQSTRRFSEPSKFALFDYLGHVLFCATPVGVLIALSFSLTKNKQLPSFQKIQSSSLLLMQISFLLPTTIFLISSLQHEPRINWSGPGFIAILPIFAAHISGKLSFFGKYNLQLIQSWSFFLPLSAIGFVLFWIYCAFGFPLVPYKPSVNKLIGWEFLGQRVSDLREEVLLKTGHDPLIIGMDKHYTAAELAFYMRKARPNLAEPAIAGRSVFGLDALMWAYWKPEGELAGKDAILVARSKSDLEFPEVVAGFVKLEEIQEVQSSRAGKKAGRYFYRIGRGLKLEKNEREL